jgi:hypothetical protein
MRVSPVQIMGTRLASLYLASKQRVQPLPNSPLHSPILSSIQPTKRIYQNYSDLLNYEYHIPLPIDIHSRPDASHQRHTENNTIHPQQQ